MFEIDVGIRRRVGCGGETDSAAFEKVKSAVGIVVSWNVEENFASLIIGVHLFHFAHELAGEVARFLAKIDEGTEGDSAEFLGASAISLIFFMAFGEELRVELTSTTSSGDIAVVPDRNTEHLMLTIVRFLAAMPEIRAIYTGGFGESALEKVFGDFEGSARILHLVDDHDIFTVEAGGSTHDLVGIFVGDTVRQIEGANAGDILIGNIFGVKIGKGGTIFLTVRRSRIASSINDGAAAS